MQLNATAQTAQDPLLARAGQFLHRVTGRAFSTLAVDYGKDDLPELVAVRAQGTRVPVVGLSEGTRTSSFCHSGWHFSSCERPSQCRSSPMISYRASTIGGRSTYLNSLPSLVGAHK